jgi:hypothetical protein
MPGLRSVLIAAMAALFAPALFALDSQVAPAPANTAVPGTLNYIEGSATLNGQPLNQYSVGNAVLEPDQVISTTTGHAEVLLTPGVYLRLGPDSAAQMVSPDLTDTAVKITRGHAAVEVDLLFKQNDIHVIVNNVPVQLTKPGLYVFNANRPAALVFKGEAAVDRSNGKWTIIKSGHQVSLAEGPNLRPAKFDVDAQEQSDLYRWSSLRSDYLAEANEQIAGEYGEGYAPGWYWDPWMWDYTFLGPYPFYSPFGWGFYPLGWGGGFYGGYYGHGRGFYGHTGRPAHFADGGSHGSTGGFHGGDFGGGGFHGGGFGGGGFGGGGGRR